MIMADISDSTRKVLWARSGNTCAFKGCGQRLELPAQGGSAGSVVGHECHIVAKKDDPRIARAPSTLSEEEATKYVHLIKSRNSLSNLVLMCATHSMEIDAIEQGYSVQAVLAMKELHEAKFESLRVRELAASPGDFESESPSPTRPLLIEDVSAWQRKAIRALAQADIEGLAWLHQVAGSPSEAGRIAALIEAQPDELVSGSPELLTAVAREAEAHGLWSAAAEVWELRADTSTGLERADLYVRAAIDAGVDGDAKTESRLLERAREIDPNCVRLRLQELDDSLSPEEQISYLDELETDDKSLASLIAAQKALSYLLLEDIGAAERLAKETDALEADSVASRMLSINIEIQKGRLALVGDRPFFRAEVQAAGEQALQLREELIPMGRWEEAARLLMLAAESPLLLRNPSAARSILELTREEELRLAPLGADVLGDAALRADAPDLALRFVETAATSSDAIQRIRASAILDSGGPDTDLALERLESLRQGGGPEAEMAAAARLLACLPPVHATWDDLSAKLLEGGPHHNFVKRVRVHAALHTDAEQAKHLADELPDESWGAQIRLEVAGYTQDQDRLVRAADDFARFGPDAYGEIQIIRALADGGDKRRAERVAFRVSRDLNAPPRVRSDACELRLRILADLEDWGSAKTAWQEWSQLVFGELEGDDQRLSAWQVRVANRNR
jgi:hypothetical protein